MTIYVFTGPSLPPQEAGAYLDAVFLPPAAQGDILRVVTKFDISALGIIDGYFHNVPSIWHKEILYAMSMGIPVFGSASMGALRAAELAQFGMIGVGAIFEAFREGTLEDDDEVAIIHGPADLGFPNLSEAMVNIRRTLTDAVLEGAIDENFRKRLEEIAKELPYPKRTYLNILAIGKREMGIEATERFCTWLSTGRKDQKREDAISMLHTMRDHYFTDRVESTFHFEHTSLWQHALSSVENNPSTPQSS